MVTKDFWWPIIQNNVVKLCQACQVCATRQVGKPTKPFLFSVPVYGPFDHDLVGVDVQFLPSSKGNKYAPECSWTI